MELLALLARSALIWNRNKIMGEGGRALAARLDARLRASKNQVL